MPPYAPSNERVVLSVKPALRSIVLRVSPTVLVCAALALATRWGLPKINAGTWSRTIILALGSLALARLFWELAVWASRRYMLSERRVLSISGVLHRQIRDLPLVRVQNSVLDRSLAQRVFGLGTIGIASAGSAWIDVAWVMIADPSQRLNELRRAIEHAQRDRPTDDAQSADPPDRPIRENVPGRAIVIGLAGGIGAGKSEVAGILESLGCVVFDSDAEAKRLLHEPEVIATLREWWGDSVLDDAGEVDRSRVASIVFGDPQQRARLEALVHPRLKASRQKIIEARRDARGIVIDAPLLFETGVNRECDVVIFVDTRSENRLERVRSSRGWDEHELVLREGSQWLVERKRIASDEIVANDGSSDDLRLAVADALESIERRWGRQQKKNTSG